MQPEPTTAIGRATVWIVEDNPEFRSTVQELVDSAEDLSVPHTFASGDTHAQDAFFHEISSRGRTSRSHVEGMVGGYWFRDFAGYLRVLRLAQSLFDSSENIPRVWQSWIASEFEAARGRFNAAEQELTEMDHQLSDETTRT